MKLVIRIFLGFLALLLIVVAGGAIWFFNLDLKPWAERTASDALGRRVVAERLEITWGNPLHIELQGLKIANAPWGSTPEMITLKTFTADADPWSLWDGKPVYRHMRAEGLVVVLERDKAGTGNWKFGGEDGGSSSGGFALIPKNRTQFPTLLDMVLKDALITYRTFHGNVLRIGLENVAISADGENTPVILKAAGAYNNTPLILDAETQSFIVLRDRGVPFGTKFTLAGKTAKLFFDGTMMEPLDFEGVDGAMRLDAERLQNLVAAFGGEIVADYPLTVDAHLTRKNDHWEMTEAKGQLAGDSFTGKLVLDEGSRGAPDRLATDLTFPVLRVDALLPKETGSGGDLWQTKLVPPAEPGSLIEAKLQAGELIYGNTKLRDVVIAAGLRADEVAVDSLAFTYAGGRVTAGGAVKQGAATSLRLQLDRLDMAQVMTALGGATKDISGRLDGAGALSLNGETLGAALQKAGGAVVLSMREGSITRSLIEQASTDLRALFREKAGTSPIKCFGAVLVVKDGLGTLAPLQLRTGEAVLNGSGTLDFRKREIDIRAKSERESTGFFALDLPIKVSGPLTSPSVGLAGDAEAEWKPLKAADMSEFPPELRQIATENPCLTAPSP